jgi:membrane-associated phospholipid phosphatase
MMLAYAFVVPVLLFLILWALFFMPFAGVALLAKAVAKGTSARVARTALGKRALARAAWPGVRAYVPIVIVVVLGVVAAIGAGLLFMQLAMRVNVTTSAVNQFDHVVWAFVGHVRQPWLTAMFSVATQAGGSLGMVPIVAVTAVLLFLHKERASAVYVIGTSSGGELLNLGLKEIFARARPDLADAITSSRWYSFPSGHAMSSFIVLCAVSYVVMRQPWRWRVKSAFLAGATAFALLVGTSRVYLGVHWASDIAGGWSAAIVWLASVTVAVEWSLRLRQRRRGERASRAAADVPDKPIPASPVAS